MQVSELAYRKIVYHLVRYPTSKVTGNQTTYSGALVGNGLQVVDAYPLFHTPIVNPTFSVALDLIESNLPEGQKIIGFYEFVEGSEPKINSIIESNPLMKDMIAMRVLSNTHRCGLTLKKKSNLDLRASTSSLHSGPLQPRDFRTASIASLWTSTRTSRRSSWTLEILIFNDLCYPPPAVFKISSTIEHTSGTPLLSPSRTPPSISCRSIRPRDCSSCTVVPSIER